LLAIVLIKFLIYTAFLEHDRLKLKPEMKIRGPTLRTYLIIFFYFKNYFREYFLCSQNEGKKHQHVKRKYHKINVKVI